MIRTIRVLDSLIYVLTHISIVNIYMQRVTTLVGFLQRGQCNSATGLSIEYEEKRVKVNRSFPTLRQSVAAERASDRKTEKQSREKEILVNRWIDCLYAGVYVPGV